MKGYLPYRIVAPPCPGLPLPRRRGGAGTRSYCVPAPPSGSARLLLDGRVLLNLVGQLLHLVHELFRGHPAGHELADRSLVPVEEVAVPVVDPPRDDVGTDALD